MDDPATQNSQARRIAIALVVVLLLAGGAWWYWHQPASAENAAVTPAARVAGAAAPAPAPEVIRHPLQPVTGAADAAAVAVPVDSEARVQAGLTTLFGEPALAQWLIPDQLLRRLVATTDNLARNARIEPLRPLRAPATPFAVQREVLDATTGTERITLGAPNFSRYDAVVALLAKTDMAAGAQLYRQLYPALQKSYEDLGYPDQYFNDRVVEIIDHLLATPEPVAPLLLEQPKVMYRYADVELESRSAGQKLLLRMGVNHTRVVQQKLREFRAQIAIKE